MFRNTSILIGLFFAVFANLTYSQDAHYTYPFSIECPTGVIVAPGTENFTATFENGNVGAKYSPVYSWSVSQGTIAEGQGTTAISVRVGIEGAGTSLIVTLDREFSTPHFPGVQRTANCVVPVVAGPTARMTDEFRTRGNNCEEGLARLDAFLTELHNDPNANGVIVSYGDTTAKGASRVRQLQLQRYARSRGFDLTRLSFVLGAPRESGTTQFWLVPAGAEPPVVETGPLVPESRPTLPYMHSARYVDGVPECNSYDYDLQDYARVLNMEPAARARVIISETSKASFNRELKEITKELAKNGVSPRRIVAIYKNVRRNMLQESIELWVIPGRRTKP